MTELSSLNTATAPLRFEWPERPRCSIVICVYNQIEPTLMCLRALLKGTPGGSHEVIVVDDGSDEDTARALQGVGGVRLVRHSENRGFPAAVNTGASVARGELLVLLNSDTEVHPGWLAALCDCIDSAPDIAAAGSRLVNADGSQQYAAAVVFNDGSIALRGSGDYTRNPAYGTRHEVDYCAGAALMVRADAFRACGGMDLRFGRGYYEDVDLCFGLRRLGYRVMYEPRSAVSHIGGISFMQLGRTTSVAEGTRNRVIFAAKWAEELEHHYPVGTTTFYRGRVDHAPWVIVVDGREDEGDYVEPLPRPYWLALSLRELGCEVTFVSEGVLENTIGLGRLRDSGVEVWTPPHRLSALARERPNMYGTVFLCETKAIHLIDDVRRAWPRALVAFDTGRVRPASVAENGSVGGHAREWLGLAALRAADIVTVSTADVAADVLRLAPKARVAALNETKRASADREDLYVESLRTTLCELVERRLA